MTAADLVQVERDGPVALLVLNRPEARNAMDAALAQATVDAIEGCQDAAAMVLTGADPAFCAGLDLRALGVDRLTALPGFIAAAASSQVPMIAAVNGAAVTGGLELALACDFIVASEQARFADTHLRVGVYPGPVLVELPRRVGMARAREMSLTGNFVDADTALRIGLANHVVGHEDLVPFAMDLARAVAEQDATMVRAMRRDWDATDRLPVAEAHRLHGEHAEQGGFTTVAAGDIAARRETVIDRAHRQAPDAGP
ncbi:enoyl-CoA hydratase/isomerase family protein [Acidiferrimicrobium sp. IK]|uniref:enoyl-CoA hydratase-related protein n=1 Tax=Acidiferrimicrobium sp. IK TaxID=2871700 RepID=UPI0021CB9628|nr:enoyl-CoA hydratase-related protein [Acidiferrimicrobium sp. IK]MCU4183498.1 enoyl-CoA hydratase/isomerase family protein [Acidiferrimicrobium sp. IK]